ncbi:putative DNA cross-link repair 1A protein [Trypanosoma rangeli]|uniref:Putative DNA cross-link repair 1A protein n=1 Tax=Trypanosoma rangeli TaxID=5698 RepID=A0A422P493_TRYRA|nr:putative DNA cross-link repair 1A protein [Trypanosoma rangeli]RNF12539.1 putative DNA cross-link repair 1A protein [Trypanosoma rangeli]|eukprot:RNF12539.1 putative DNA cross-link repair 1A protein [Trypanosoma rangeli]
MKLPLFPVYIDQFYSDGAFDAVYLLSHFHTDHMKGLSPSWSEGLIISDTVTQALLAQSYGDTLEKRTVSLPLFQRTPLLSLTTSHSCSEASRSGGEKRYVSLDYVKQTHSDDKCGCGVGEEGMVALYLLPAFHIPGSVMFFLETPCGNILYTGDFKYDEHARRRLDPFFANHRVDHVYLDDTWLHLGIHDVSLSVKGNEGTQVQSKILSEMEVEEAIEAVGRRMDRRVRDFALDNNSCNKLCGPYVLRVYLHNQFGKEHLVQRLATRLAVPVVVDQTRYERIRLLASFNEKIAEVDERFCMDVERFVPFENCGACPRVEVVSSLKQISPEGLRAAAERNGGTPHYGIVMSGWALFRQRGGKGDETSVWEIPTTLHCTPQQIIDFVALLRPMSVTPLHYKPCRSVVVLQRLGPFLRRPYMNHFLSVSDGLKDDAKEWLRCIVSSNNARGEAFFAPKRSGFCIGSSSMGNTSPQQETSLTSGGESLTKMERQRRKRAHAASLSSIRVRRCDYSLCSATPSLTQLAEFLDL